MADPTFNLFGPIKPNDLTVGYISTDRGYQTGMTVCEANDYAKLNPGTTFIFKPDRKTVEFLNINQLNELSRNPTDSTTDQSCPDGLDMNAEPEPTKVVFMGGGGVGAVANPVVGDDGALLAIDLVNGGFGYKYPPLVEIRDDSGIGAGAVVKIDVGEIEEQLIYYGDKEDFEHYETCPSPLPKDEFGRRWTPDGKDLGDWTPQSYTDGSIPFKQVVDEYIKSVQNSGKDWWTTRKEPPLQVTSTGQSNRTFYEVTHSAWGAKDGFMNTYAISPVPPSNVKPSDHAGKWYTFEWNVNFPYDGEYIFRTARDNKSRIYIDNVPFTDKLQTFTGTNLASGKVGQTSGHGNKITLKKGFKVLRLDLWNEPQKEKIAVQQKLVGSTKEVIFNITSASLFANSIRIDELGILESKKYDGPNIKSKITKDIEYGKRYKVVLNSPQSTAGVKLRIKDQTILQMEDHTDDSWDDVVCTATSGYFHSINENVCYFTVDAPELSDSTSTKSEGSQTREVFNTVDYISKANRKLWRTNVYSRGGFLNDYGVCPFNTKLQLKDNPYAGDHTIVWQNVSFPIDGNYLIQVAVDDNVDLTIGDQVRLNKKGFEGDTNLSTGVLKTTRFIKGGNYNITAKLNQKAGGAFSFKSQDGKKKTKVKFNVAVSGDYGNQITIPGILSLGKEFKGAGALLNEEREVEVGKEYDVIITSIRSAGGRAETQHRKGAIRFRKTRDRSGGLSSSGPRLEFEDKLEGVGREWNWNLIQASVSQGRFYAVSGNRCKFMVGESMKGINPMALAINIETEFAEEEIEAKRSWNENPMGIALTIDSPSPTIPQAPVPQSEGRCPNNPFWTTRFPGAKEFWHPVNDTGQLGEWGPLLNELAISPLPPSDDEGNPENDLGSFTNTWTKEFPYGGWYKVIMEVDDIGQFWIGDVKHIDLSRRRGKTRDEKLIYIEGPLSPDDDPITHDIKVVVENYKSLRTKVIDAKVFNTLDWISGGTSKAAKKSIDFRITSGSMFANSISIPELGIFEAKEFTPVRDEQGIHMGQRGQIKVSLQRDVEVNKVYDVELLSSNSTAGVKLRTKGENVLQMEDHTDSDWTDIQCSATEGRFFDFKPGATKATCKYVVTSATKVSGGVSGSTTRDGVTYEGPHLFHYEDSRWGKIINQSGVSPIGSPTQNLSEPNDNILGKKILIWKNVDFPKTGMYQISFKADNTAQLFIDDKRVAQAKQPYAWTSGSNEHQYENVKLSKGKHDVKIILRNENKESNVFVTNPTGVVLSITTKQRIGTGEYKSWKENPIAVAVKLIPPPCPKKVKGKGRVQNPIVTEPGNGYPKPPGPQYPVLLKVKDITVKDPGINYNCATDTIRLEPSNGSELELVCGPFGKIVKVNVINPGLGFTRMPDIIVDSDTGVNLDIAIQFAPELAPFDIPNVVQVTDLVGLKQTGYYKGKPYYGAVFYENGVKYSGWYRTAGEMVQVYDTMQESIDGMVTTPPSAILRQGSDPGGNNPRLNIPGTPENRT